MSVPHRPTEVIAAPPSTPTGSSALIIDSLHISVYLIGSPGAGTLFTFDVETGSCSGTRVGPYFQQVIPGTIGEIDIPLDPGVRSRPEIRCAPFRQWGVVAPPHETGQLRYPDEG